MYLVEFSKKKNLVGHPPEGGGGVKDGGQKKIKNAPNVMKWRENQKKKFLPPHL